MIRNIEKIIQSLAKDQTPLWYSDLRSQGFSRFTESGTPTLKDEAWKYTDLKALNKHPFDIVQDNALRDPEVINSLKNPEGINIVLVNGVLSEKLSDFERKPEGLSILSLREAVLNNEPCLKEQLTKYSISDETVFTALNQALSNSGIYIRIDKGASTPHFIHIIHVSDSKHSNIALMPRTLIAMAPSSEATILESHISLTEKTSYFSNALTDIFLEDGAILHYCKSQKESLKAFHIGHTRVWQERNSNFDGFSFMTGGQLTRNNLDVVLNGEGAEVRLNALYSVYNDQHVDNHTSIEHRVPNCTSSQLYKGILNDRARAVFNGRVLVKAAAQKTNSYQLNNNLLLGKDCRVDTQPQLEIFADDVKCSHGATIGQMDEDELFYLQTRCIPKDAAMKMLAQGFVDDLLNTIQNTFVREKLTMLMRPSLEAL